MYMSEYVFTPDLSKTTLNDFEYETSWFISALYKNGQISGEYLGAFKDNNQLKYLCETFEFESLESKFYNSYCEKFKKTVDLISNESSYYRYICEIVDSPDVCKCINPSGFVLYTAFAGFKSPVTCIDCNKMVPLYKLPKIKDEDEYNTLLCWQEQFRACDKLFMQSNVGEIFGYKQMSSPKSKLTVLGREICRLYEEKTKNPFYYFLYKYGNQKPYCPICNKVWGHIGNQETVYCEGCKLIAHI